MFSPFAQTFLPLFYLFSCLPLPSSLRIAFSDLRRKSLFSTSCWPHCPSSKFLPHHFNSSWRTSHQSACLMVRSEAQCFFKMTQNLNGKLVGNSLILFQFYFSLSCVHIQFKKVQQNIIQLWSLFLFSFFEINNGRECVLAIYNQLQPHVRDVLMCK